MVVYLIIMFDISNYACQTTESKVLELVTMPFNKFNSNPTDVFTYVTKYYKTSNDYHQPCVKMLSSSLFP